MSLSSNGNNNVIILTRYEPVPDHFVGVRRQSVAPIVHLGRVLVRMYVVIEAGVEQADVKKVHLLVGARPKPVAGEQRDNVAEYRREHEYDNDAQQYRVNQLHDGGEGDGSKAERSR